MKKAIILLVSLITLIGFKTIAHANTTYSLSLGATLTKVKAGDTFSLYINLVSPSSINNANGIVFTQNIDSNLEVTGVTLTSTSGTTNFTSNVTYADDNGNLLPRVVIEYGNPGYTLTSPAQILKVDFRVKDTFNSDSVTIAYGTGTYKNNGETYSSYLTHYTCASSDISSCNFTTSKIVGGTRILSRRIEYKPGSWSGDENTVAGPTDLAKYRKYLGGDSETVTIYSNLDEDVKSAIDLSGDGNLDLTDLIMLRLQLANS